MVYYDKLYFMENVMPIRIRHLDKNDVAVQQSDISRIIIEEDAFFCRRLIWIHINIGRSNGQV